MEVGAIVKTGEGRRIDLKCCPALVDLLAVLKRRAGDSAAPVFGLTRYQADAARNRLRRYGAPAGFSFQMLRRTCGTYTACSSIHGDAGMWQAARRLGHSVAVAERHYYRAVVVDPNEKTLEGAMGIADLAETAQRARSITLPCEQLSRYSKSHRCSRGRYRRPRTAKRTWRFAKANRRGR